MGPVIDMPAMLVHLRRTLDRGARAGETLPWAVSEEAVRETGDDELALMP